MSCYFRHLKEILSGASIEVTAANRKEVDQALHKIAGVAYKDCPAAWKIIKGKLTEEKQRQELVQKLKNAIG